MCRLRSLGESQSDVKCQQVKQQGTSVLLGTVLPLMSQRQNGSVLEASSCSMAGVLTTLDRGAPLERKDVEEPALLVDLLRRILKRREPEIDAHGATQAKRRRSERRSGKGRGHPACSRVRTCLGRVNQ